MTVKTVWPHTLSQSSGSNIQSFNNLSNLKNDNATYAKTGQIASKSGTRKKPATIKATNFKANIPSGSKINKVTVEYVADYEGNINIGKPTINILNIKGDNKNGKALTKTLTKTSVSWSGDHTIANMNSSDFGVSISFPANTKADVGYVKLKYIRIIIDYTAPNYKVSSSKVSGTYTNDEFKVKVNVSNVNKTTGDSNVTVQLPSGVSYTGKDSGDGSVSASGSKLTWKPGLSAKKLSASIILKLKITTDGSHNISISEAATGHKTSLNISTSARSDPTHGEEEGDDETPETPKGDDSTSIPTAKPTPTNVLQVGVNEEFSLDLSFEDYSGSSVKVYAYYNDYTFDTTDGELFGEDVQYNSAYSSGRTNKILIYSVLFSQWAFRQVNSWDYQNKKWTVMSYSLTGGLMQNLFKVTEAGYYTILMYSSDGETLLKKVLISVKPDPLSTPVMSILKLTQEELDRLGEGIGYTVQSYMKLISNQPFVRDWGKNFKIGVFNNINPNVDTTTEITETVIEDGDEISIEPTETDVIDTTDYDNLTNAQILEYAEYWSEALTVLNEFTNVTCNFVYDSNYPVYIIITGDYHEGDPLYNSIQFTEPCVVESRVYNGRESNGNYPVPILNLLENSDSAEIELKLFEKGSDLVIYQFPLDADFSVSDALAITGIELAGDIDFADATVLTAKLCNPNLESGKKSIGERSIIINDPQKENDDETFHIGGAYDLWGFKMSDIQNLENWWIEFSLNNLFDNTNDLAEVKFKNIQVTIHTNKVKSNYQKLYIDGQNVRHLGMFVTKAYVPEGLLMDTKYADIDGTDTNDAYRMNVKPKDIEIEFSVRGCNLQETTNMLRQLAKLFVNDRDELNRPIKKRLELSNYPDVYFLYLMNDPFDSDPTVAGYKSKIKLEIPDGTAFSKEDIVTGTIGVNHGLAKVKPIITFIPTGDIVEITESENNQKFKITCKDWTVENTVEIDCINRKITILNYTDSEGSTYEKDITETGDINNDWFVLHNEYSFNIDNGIIQTVRFTERW